MSEPWTPGPWHVGYDDGSGGVDDEAGAYIVARDHEDGLGLGSVVVWGGRNDWGSAMGVRRRTREEPLFGEAYAPLDRIRGEA